MLPSHCEKCQGYVIQEDDLVFSWKCVNCGKRGTVQTPPDEQQAKEKYEARYQARVDAEWKDFWRKRRLKREGRA